MHERLEPNLKIEESVEQLNQKISIGLAEVRRSTKAAGRMKRWQVIQTVLIIAILLVVAIGVIA